jgi:hypothetical protein
MCWNYSFAKRDTTTAGGYSLFLEDNGSARRACFGIRVDAAMHRMAFGKKKRPKRARLRPALVTMDRERRLARLIPRLS